MNWDTREDVGQGADSLDGSETVASTLKLELFRFTGQQHNEKFV